MKSVETQLCEIHSLGKTTRETLASARQVKSLSAHKILFAGHTVAGRGYRFVRHAPAFNQILAVTGGEGRAMVDGRWRPCPTGHVYISPARSFCAYEVRPGHNWRLCWLIYDPAATLPGLRAGSAPRLVQADTLGLHHAITGLCHEAAGEAEPAAMELLSALVHRQALRMLQPSSADPRLERLWLVVRSDLGGAWDLARLARCAGMSGESLRRLCLEYLGAPPLAYLTRLRMQYAADLIACTKEKIATIAGRVGYVDAFAFSNAFKRVLGRPPSHQRNLQK
ncbi:MAG: AraC family transcriptional regulator [Nibricoccus sp.]